MAATTVPPGDESPRRYQKLERAFYQQGAIDLARALLGKILVHRTSAGVLRARIVETEAYLGVKDLAAHSSRGRTRRTEVMFGLAGHAYVYFIYGMHEMLNVVAGQTGEAQAVLLRAGEALDGWQANLSGPGRLARCMQIQMSDNGRDMTGDELFIVESADAPPVRIGKAKRIGVDYAKHWQHRLLRFYDRDSAAVSHKPKVKKR